MQTSPSWRTDTPVERRGRRRSTEETLEPFELPARTLRLWEPGRVYIETFIGLPNGDSYRAANWQDYGDEIPTDEFRNEEHATTIKELLRDAADASLVYFMEHEPRQ